jgi:hypothetical protein
MKYRQIIADNILEYINKLNRSFTSEIISEIFSESIVFNDLSTERNINELKNEIMNNLILSKELPKFINTDAKIGYNFRGYKISCWAIEPFINILLKYIYSRNNNLSIIMFKCPLNKQNQYLENLQIKNENLNINTKISILLHVGNVHYRFIEYNSNNQILLNSLPQIIKRDILNLIQHNNLRILNNNEIIEYKKFCNSNIKKNNNKLNISNNKNNINSIINDITKQKPSDLKKILEELFGIKINKTNNQLINMNYLEMKEYIKFLIKQKNINSNIKNINLNIKNNNKIKIFENQIKEIIYKNITLQQKINELQKNFFIKFNIKQIENIYQIKLEKLNNQQLYEIFYNIIKEHLLSIRNYLSSNSSNDSKIITIKNFIKEFYNKNISKEEIKQKLSLFEEKDIFTLLNIAKIINNTN